MKYLFQAIWLSTCRSNFKADCSPWLHMQECVHVCSLRLPSVSHCIQPRCCCALQVFWQRLQPNAKVCIYTHVSGKEIGIKCLLHWVAATRVEHEPLSRWSLEKSSKSQNHCHTGALKTLTSRSLFLRFYCVTLCCRFEHFHNFFNVLFCTFNLKFVLEVQHPFMFWVYTGCFLPLLYNTLMKALCQDMLMEQREDSSSKSAQHLLVNKAINEVLHYIRLLKISDVTCCCVWLDWKVADWTFSSLEGTSCIITTALAFRALIMGRQSKQKCIHTTESGSKSLFTEESAGFHSLTGGKKINSVPKVTQLIWCGADSSG